VLKEAPAASIGMKLKQQQCIVARMTHTDEAVSYRSTDWW